MLQNIVIFYSTPSESFPSIASAFVTIASSFTFSRQLLFHKGIIMAILVESFLTLSCVGMWRPTSWSRWKSIVYNLYAVFMMIVVYAFLLLELLELLFVDGNVYDVMHALTLSFSACVVCAKFVGVTIMRENIERIRLSFHTGWLKPNTLDEIKIQKQYDRITRIGFWVCTALFQILLPGLFLVGQTSNQSDNNSPITLLLSRYNFTSAIHGITLTMQCFAFLVGSIIDVGFDTLFLGLMLQICCKMNILKHRFQVAVVTLQEMNYKRECDRNEYEKMEQQLFGDWVENHIAIFSSLDDIESVFSKLIFIQYSVSAFTLCTQAYVISGLPIFTVEFCSGITFLLGVVIQMIIYCFSGEHLTLEFSALSEVMYNTNWLDLSISAKKNIIIMMVRTLRPIVVSSGYFVTLSIASFKNIIKIAYSIYSVLTGS